MYIYARDCECRRRSSGGAYCRRDTRDNAMSPANKQNGALKVSRTLKYVLLLRAAAAAILFYVRLHFVSAHVTW